MVLGSQMHLEPQRFIHLSTIHIDEAESRGCKHTADYIHKSTANLLYTYAQKKKIESI